MIKSPNELIGMKCLLFGYGKSNAALANYLKKHGAEITVADSRKNASELEEDIFKSGVGNLKIADDISAQRPDVVFRSPSVRPDDANITVLLEKGAILCSETELFFELAKGKIIGITGSDGKTTTTTLTYLMLRKKYGDRVKIGGNIGIPLSDSLDCLDERSITVCELSSFQLMTLNKSPEISAVTNITENHLDYHRSMEEYISSKTRIASGVECMRLVTGISTFEQIKSSLKRVPHEIVRFATDRTDCEICLYGNAIYCYGEKALDTSEIRVKGLYNKLNFMTAIGICYPEISAENIESVAKEFTGVSHRAELSGCVDGIQFYNSSIDSTPSRTLATLSGFDETGITLICGGKDKNLSFRQFAEQTQKKVNKYILMGSNHEKIKKELSAAGISSENILYAGTLEEAVGKALGCTEKGGTVLFSPASTSFDMFRNFEERGEKFMEAVRKHL